MREEETNEDVPLIQRVKVKRMKLFLIASLYCAASFL